MSNQFAAQRSQYNREAILSASPTRLLTMLYDRLLLDLGRAEAALVAEEWQTASDNLLHAQAIVAELSASLKTELWDGGPALLALYTYTNSAMIAGNVHRDVSKVQEAIRLLEPLRQAWHEAAAALPADAAGTSTADAEPAGSDPSGRVLGVA